VNFLAHALLAGEQSADRLGAMLGDFVKGMLPAGLPADVAAGVSLHRRIDTFADTHPAFQRSRSRVSGERRRYAGIMVDMFYDHFLALHWERYREEPLERFAARIYQLMSTHQDLLPPRLAGMLPHMRAEDWLCSYRLPTSIGVALDRMAEHRLSRANTLGGSLDELQRCYAGFEADFLVFFPDALSFAEGVRANRQFAL
jgi:acyl carrier protein phosphodiesterase